MPNHLAHETSPYLLQHADNPVDWWPWSTAAFEEARRGGVPVLFSGGAQGLPVVSIAEHNQVALNWRGSKKFLNGHAR
ncbi:DUF255 domain-containing protein [Streptomyces kasugaensis]|uniref:DUF255 domain-containing protein n=1 Tax=Streptomyces kasugaensis TaxID=1946 RepID=A0A4Q9I093_STRKA|nr:DUF255 domain-containing protein [Streptomyces kasugaensis]